MKAKKKTKTTAWIIEDGKWATDQMLVYKTKKSAQQRVLNGGMQRVWKVYKVKISYL